MQTILALRSPTFLPDAISALLFETHWALWIGAIVIGALCLFLARSRSDRRLLRTGQVLLAIALVWLIAARLVDTPAERLYNAHAALAEAVQKNDIDKILSFLDKDFSAPNVNIKLDTSARAEIEQRLKTYGISDTRITAYSLKKSDATALTSVSVYTKTALSPMITRWQLSWIDDPASDWKIIHAQLTHLGDQPVPQTEVIP